MVNSKIQATIERMIKTDRLTLIPQSRVHAQEMFNLLNDITLHEYTGDTPPVSVEFLENRYTKLESRRSPDGDEYWLNWVVQLENSVLVGYVQSTISHDQAMIAWVIGSMWQGNGYAGEAAVALVQWLRENGFKKIRACIHPLHKASQAVAKKAGLTQLDELIDGEEVWELNA